jgi:hypothetical protein
MNTNNLLRDPRSLVNPFRYMAGTQALLWGLMFMVASSFIGWINNYWQDGLIDLHAGSQGAFWQHLALVIFNWLSLLIVLFPLALWLSDSKIRFIDMAGTLALARFPMFLAVFTGFSTSMTRVGEYMMYSYLNKGEPVELRSFDLPLTITLGFLILLMVVWMVTLNYQAYKVSANLRGTQAGVSFTIGFIAAYALSKWMVWLIV